MHVSAHAVKHARQRRAQAYVYIVPSKTLVYSRHLAAVSAGDFVFASTTDGLNNLYLSFSVHQGKPFFFHFPHFPACNRRRFMRLFVIDKGR